MIGKASGEQEKVDFVSKTSNGTQLHQFNIKKQKSEEESVFSVVTYKKANTLLRKVEDPLSSRLDNCISIQIVKEKRKRYWGEIVVFPPPFKKRYVFSVFSTPCKTEERDSEKNGVHRSCHYHSKKRALDDLENLGDDSHVQLNKFFICSSRKRPWNGDIHIQSLGSSGAYAKKLRVSG